MQPEALAWAIVQAEGTRWRALADAFTSGELEVRLADGRSVRYRSTDEMASVIAAGYAAVGVADSARRPTRTIAVVGDGFR
jgi:hypothetical protein